MSSTSYQQALQKVRNDYMAASRASAVTSALSVVGNLNMILLVGWLMGCGSVSQRTFQRGRLPMFFSILSVSLWNLLYTRSLGVVGSVGVGLNSALCTVMAINFIIQHDPRHFTRLALLHRTDEMSGKPNLVVTVFREDMPGPTWERLYWTLDLITGFRGVHWSWDPKMSPQQEKILRAISHSPSLQCPKLVPSKNPQQSSSLCLNSSRFLLDYFLIDCLKSIMIADPYFLGHITEPAPPHIRTYISSRNGVYTYRILLGAAGVALAVEYLFALAVLIQVNILGIRILSLNGSPLLFPPIWGSPKAIWRKGLRGFWGETWHQMFRTHFVSIGDAVVVRLMGPNFWTDSYGPLAVRRTIRVAVAFLLSGILHACASYTLLGPTRPWKCFLFFAIQPLGMALQNICSMLFAGLFGSTNRWKMYVCRPANLGFTAIWLWMLAGLALDDMTSGGMWLAEPVPFSLVRSLGLSKEDNRFWCWSSSGMYVPNSPRRVK